MIYAGALDRGLGASGSGTRGRIGRAATPEIVMLGGTIGTDITRPTRGRGMERRGTSRTTPVDAPARNAHAMAGANGSVVLFGGLDASGKAVGDVGLGRRGVGARGPLRRRARQRHVDVGTLRSMPSEIDPPARSAAGMFTLQGTLYVLAATTKDPNDTWLWIDPGWSAVSGAAPSARTPWRRSRDGSSSSAASLSTCLLRTRGRSMA